MLTVTMHYGKFRIQSWLNEVENMKSGPQLTYVQLAMCARGKDHAYPRHQWLAGKVNVTSRTIQTYIKWLVQAGLISVTQELVKGCSRKRNIYWFLAHPAIKTDDAESATLEDGEEKNFPVEPEEFSGPLYINKDFNTTHSADAEGESHEIKQTEETDRATAQTDESGDGPDAGLRGFERGRKDESARRGEKIGRANEQSECSGRVRGGNAGNTGRCPSLTPWVDDAAWTEAKAAICASSPHLRPLLDQLASRRLADGTLSLDGPAAPITTIIERQYGRRIAEALRQVGVDRHQYGVWSPELRQRIEARDQARADRERIREERQRQQAVAARAIRLAQMTPAQQFEQLETAYPAGKSGWWAKQVFLRMHKRGDIPALPVLLSALSRQKDNPSWQRDNARWVPKLNNWLTQHQWEQK